VQTCTSGAATTGTFGELDSDIVTAGHNDLWPGETGAENAPTQGTPPAGCTPVIPGGVSSSHPNGVSGGPALLATLAATAGGVGYVDYSDERNDTVDTADLTSPTVEDAYSTALNTTLGYQSSGVTYTAASSGNGSNCNGSVSLPGTNSTDVGTGGDWALDFGQSGTFNPQNYDDIAWTNEPTGKYGACTLTWDYVWGNDSGNAGAADPEPELNANQRRTLFSYFTYVFSPAGQESETSAGYAPLPASDFDTFRQAFQGNF
jgi:hypothetical protein